MDFSERIKQLRKEAKLTQSDLADKLLVHSQTISKWERGLIEPDVAILGDLATALGISIDKLLGLPEGDTVFTGVFSPSHLGNALFERRIEKNESQESVGTALNVSADTVSRWERGTTCPSASELCDLAKHFEIPVSKLYFGAEEKPTLPAMIKVKRTRPMLIGLITSLSLCFILSIALIIVGVNASDDKNFCTISLDGESVQARQGESFYPAIPERAGYDFVGWFDSDEKQISIPHIVKEDCNFTSRFKLHEYNISFWLNGGKFEQTPTDKFTIESGSIELPVPKKEGYDFLGWYLDPAYKDENTTSISCDPRDVVVYAKWNVVVYTIKYELDGGTIYESNPSQVTAETIEKLNAPAKLGYTFIGWYDKPDGGELCEYVGGEDAKNQTLYAIWQKIDKKYTIEYEYNDGIIDGKNPDIIRAGEVIQLSPTYKTGYNFLGWNDQPDGSGEYYTRLLNVSSDIKLYAIFEAKQYMIIYRYDGSYKGEPNPNYVLYGEKITLNPVHLHGYKFEGWYTDEKDGEKIEEINETNIARLTKLYARYSIIKYTIKLDLQEGTLQEGEPYEYNVTVESQTFALPKPKKPGFKFLGWFDENGNKYSEIKSTDAGDFTLTARWLDLDKTYNIIYILGADDATHDNPDENKCGNMLMLEPATRTGYDFLGWSFTPNGSRIELISAENEDDVTLYANWQIIKEEGVKNEWVYEKTINGVTIKTYTGNIRQDLSIIIPSQIDGVDVVEIESLNRIAAADMYLKRLVIPDGVLKLGKLFTTKISIIEPVEIPASVTELGDYCFDKLYGCINFAPNSKLKTIGNYALTGITFNSIILPDSVETIGVGAIKTSEVVLSKNLKTLLYSAVTGCTQVFFPEGISKSLTNIDPGSMNFNSANLYLPRLEETALKELLKAKGIAINNAQIVDKHNITLDYGSHTKTICDYYTTLPQIAPAQSVFIGWSDESASKIYNTKRLFVPKKDVTLKAVYVRRSEKDGLSEETVAEIDPAGTTEIYLASNGLIGEETKFYFTVKTDTAVFLKISIIAIQGNMAYSCIYGNNDLPLPDRLFKYEPGTVIKIIPGGKLNKVFFAGSGCCKIRITITMQNN